MCKIICSLFFFLFILSKKNVYCTVSLYGQCGGQSYTGDTNCTIGTTCFAQSSYFSQCLFTCPSGWLCPASSTPSPANTGSF